MSPRRATRRAATASVAWALSFAACSSATAQQSAASAAPPEGPLAPLAFMAGCWAEGPEGLHEQFTAPTANLILGTSRFLRGGGVVEFEFHVIRPGESGPILTPHPGGRASVSFAADSIAPGYVAWANPDHDFPQRIIYDGREEGALRATIEGPRDGETARMSWRMARVRCPAT
ncbi:MAG TPA: DUF6265 family protein [Longimicrobiales bacterium]|nr:DUF6265 family protein [Longimicrobiales bacterium]